MSESKKLPFSKHTRCCICNNPQTDRAHIKTRGAGAGWDLWEFVYLCRNHHMIQGHIGWKRFCDKHPQALAELKLRGWDFVNEFGTWKLRQLSRPTPKRIKGHGE